MKWTTERFHRLAVRRGYEESLEPAWWSPFSIYQGEGKPRRLFFFTKDILCRSWWRPLPKDVVALVHYGIPTPLHLDMIREWLGRVRGCIRFIGDLDPMDLMVFAALRSADPFLRAGNRQRLEICYAGINDDWLGLCRRRTRRGFSHDPGVIAMPPLERKHLELVSELVSDLEALIGPRCLELLTSGYKLELEGASNPALYQRGFIAELRRHVMGGRKDGG